MIKAVLIDVDNTLLDFGKCARQSMIYGCAAAGLPYSEVVCETFHRINDDLWHRLERGEIEKPQIYDTRWNIIFSELGMKYDGREFERIFSGYLSESTEPVDGAYELLDYLSGKYTVSIASNAHHIQQFHRLQKAGMMKYLHKLFISDEVGYTKPSPDFWRACVRSLSIVTADEIMMIGDSLTADISGCAEVGIHTCWFNHDRVPHPPVCAAEHIADSLPEIREIL
ncbi:MAG: YjjG family noncanonical pyrimidine nucleotidase [Clostridia bacterium]|nr:YjjG family noncanonical pyrimidine nucleotidase [Clostridia bacterium]